MRSRSRQAHKPYKMLPHSRELTVERRIDCLESTMRNALLAALVLVAVAAVSAEYCGTTEGSIYNVLRPFPNSSHMSVISEGEQMRGFCLQCMHCLSPCAFVAHSVV